MKNKNISVELFFFFFVLFPVSCVNLKTVSSFSSASLNNLENFEDINFSFGQFCKDRCQFEAIRKVEIDKELKCNCTVYESADSITLLIYNSLRGYFDGLAKIAAGDLTDYNFDALKIAFNEGTFGTVKISKEEVNAYAAISKILLKVTTDIYRKNKIAKYIEEANMPVQVLLNKLKSIVHLNMEEELEFKKLANFTYCVQLLDTTLYKDHLNHVEKSRIALAYYQQNSMIDLQKKQIETFSKSIATIAEGHQKLYDNRNKITAKEVREMLIGYISNLEDIETEINKLKK
jgi:hypothetical protein